MNHRTRSYLLFVLLIGCICYLVSHFVVQLYFINGSSMEPTYTSGQPVLLQKFGLPDCLDYNDVVVIRHETLGRDIVKRIVALPGDTGKGGADMTLLELSAVYAENAAVLHGRITELRRMVRLEPDRETARALQRRVEALLPLWREARSLARITAHYYDREAFGWHI